MTSHIYLTAGLLISISGKHWFAAFILLFVLVLHNSQGGKTVDEQVWLSLDSPADCIDLYPGWI